jgi:hypothetical protein
MDPDGLSCPSQPTIHDGGTEYGITVIQQACLRAGYDRDYTTDTINRNTDSDLLELKYVYAYLQLCIQYRSIPTPFLNTYLITVLPFG